MFDAQEENAATEPRDADASSGRVGPGERSPTRAPLADLSSELVVASARELRDAVRRRDLAARATAPRCWYAVDLDDVQGALETLGVRAAETLTSQLAARLASAAGPDAFVAEGAGAQFWIEAPVLRKDDAMASALDTAAKFYKALSDPIMIDGEQIAPAPWIGAAVRISGEDPEAAAQRAEIALAEARRAGERILIFDEGLRARTLARRDLLVDLRAGMGRGEIEPWLQPIVRPGTSQGAAGRVNFELLARWRHPERGLVSPAEFVPLAEESGLIPALGGALIDRAAASIAEWSSEGLIGYASINVSMVEFQDPAFAAQFVERLKDQHVPEGAVTVEITETSLGEDHGLARRHIQELSSAGVRVALDDFGTGYSNLRALMEMPIHTVKLDRSLICDVGVDTRASELVRAVAQIGRALEFSIVAEGVETLRQAEFAETVGCEMLQGYLFARPMPADEFAAWAIAHHNAHAA